MEEDILNKIFIDNSGFYFKVLEKTNMKSKSGNYLFKILYLKSKNIFIVPKASILKGNIEDSLEKDKEFLSKLYIQNCGDTIQVLEKSSERANNHWLYKVEFLKYKYSTLAPKGKIIEGKVRNPYIPSVFNLGFCGEGKIDKQIYSVWYSIFDRCYNSKSKCFIYYGKLGVSISKEWYNFQNFQKWYIENSNWNLNKYNLEIDKDILAFLNDSTTKEYTSKNCLLIPKEINFYITTFSKNYCTDKNKEGYYIDILCDGRRFYEKYLTYEEAKVRYIYLKKKKFLSLLDKYSLPDKLKDILINFIIKKYG